MTSKTEKVDRVELAEKVEQFKNRFEGVFVEVHKRIHNMAQLIELVLIALLTGQHVLIESVPGLAKTTLVEVMQRVFHGKFTAVRIQGTPDMLPMDIIGHMERDPEDGTLVFRPGPIFNNILLIDEINRMSPKTQAALLEAMSQGQVTVNGVVHELPRLFVVLATQNPLEFEGTYPLPEAQLDRFAFKCVLLPVTAKQDFLDIMAKNPTSRHKLEIGPAMKVEELEAAGKLIELIGCEYDSYMAELAEATHADEKVRVGVSPRGPIFLRDAAKARAMVSGREYVVPEDIAQLVPFVFPHRIIVADDYLGEYEEADAVKRAQSVVALPKQQRS